MSIDLASIFAQAAPVAHVDMREGATPVVRTDAAAVHEILASLHAGGFDFLEMVTALDNGTAVEMLYLLTAVATQEAVEVRCSLPNANLAVPSVCDIWAGANWQEREVYDLFGVWFDGHPDLKRILLPDDFVGHPLRKAFESDRVVKRPDYI